MNGYIRSKHIVIILLAGLALLAAGCGGAPATPITIEVVPVEQGLVPPAAEENQAHADTGAAAPAEAPAEAESFARGERAGESGGPVEAVPPAAGGGEGLVIPPPTMTAPGNVPPDTQFQSPLQAGRRDDNANFSEYLQYRLDFQNFLGLPVHDVDISERHMIQVTTSGGRPVLGAQVFIYDGQTLVTALRTPATGLVYFFPRAYPATANAQSYTVTVSKGSATAGFTLTRENTDALWPVTLDTAPAQPPVQLDVLFLLDTTGSMSDEIDQLKENILSISAQIRALPSRPDVRFALVSYRDRGDVYITNTVDFTSDVQQFQRELMNVQAGGGGDDPESLNEALHQAVQGTSWRVDNTVSLIFLVADAPPHLDYPQDFDYAVEMERAARLGIKIIPIASRLDGGDYYQKQAEYIFRQLAQFTGASFIFLTYADTPQASGTPGTEYNVPEGSYTVEDLDTLVVRLVEEELSALFAQQ
jgi:Mg-chelatase subunit ChlD